MASYVSPQQIAQHVGKHPKTVILAIHRYKVRHEKLGGPIGLRLTTADANRFIQKVWLKPPMPEAETISTGQAGNPRTESVS